MVPMARSQPHRSQEVSSSPTVWISTLVAVIMIAGQIASKAIRDGFFLTEFEVTTLPTAVVAAAVVSFASAFVFSRLIGTFSPFVVVPVLFGIHGLLFFVEALFADGVPRLVASALYLHTAAFGGAVVSGFWSVVNESFDPYTARQVMGKIAGGATFGGVLGGFSTWLFSDLPIPFLLVGLAVASWVCGVALLRMHRDARARPKKRKSEPARLFDGISNLIKEPYPRFIGVLVFLGAAMTALIDYVFKASVTEHNQSLVGFFAVFYTASGVVTFFVQSVGSRKILKNLGVVATVFVFPLVAFGGLIVALFFFSAISLIVLRAAAMVVENSLYRSGYELLYTPIPRQQKRSAKVLIDLGCDRLGTAAGSGIALVLVAASWASASQILLILALVVAVFCMGVLVRLRREYVGSLEAQIRRNTLDAAASESAVLTNTFVGDFDYGWQHDTGESDGHPSTEAQGRVGYEAFLKRVQELAKEKKKTARTPRAYESHQPPGASLSDFLDTPLVHALQGTVGFESETWGELRRSAPSLVGQLSDALLSERGTIGLRLRAAELLCFAPSQRTASALLEALQSSHLRVRRAAAIALHRVCRERPWLAPHQKMLSALAAAELRRPARVQADDTDFERSSSFRLDARGRRLAPSLEMAFLLLAVGGDSAALRLSLHAITSTDPHRRGTGLEYLDNLLPSDVRTRIIGLVEHPELAQVTRRFPPELMEELAEQLRSKRATLQEIRADYRAFLQADFDRGSEAL